MAIKFEMLRCFVTVANHGGLTDAAIALRRTPSAVSMMLRQFEDHVGSPLFETARKSRLTPVGAAIFEEARREVNHFENTIATIEGFAKSELGNLRLAVTPSVATTILPPVILQFTQAHPKIQIDIRDMDSAAIAHELICDRVDVGIGTLAAIDGMRRTELFSDAFGVVCRKGHALEQNWDSLTWQDMHEHVFIANGLCDLITDPDFAPILAQSYLMVPNTASLLALVRAGDCITVLPRLAVPALQSDVVFLPLADVTARRTVQMIARPANLLMPAAREFMTLMTTMTRNSPLAIPS
jgi:DNA-binding transcriptional LysR family regulator